MARYFVLQGAIHRINLIDHTEVHFPPDAINAITKTVLPKDNLVLCLLQPHLWLSISVNNTVLEGQRSLINRNTWYPWSPFVAKGDEVRKLLPFGWFGSEYYAAEGASRDPAKDPVLRRAQQLVSVIQVSIRSRRQSLQRYGHFLNSYFAPDAEVHARASIEHMNDNGLERRSGTGRITLRPGSRASLIGKSCSAPMGRRPTRICLPTRLPISSGMRRCAIRPITRRSTKWSTAAAMPTTIIAREAETGAVHPARRATAEEELRASVDARRSLQSDDGRVGSNRPSRPSSAISRYAGRLIP